MAAPPFSGATQTRRRHVTNRAGGYDGLHPNVHLRVPGGESVELLLNPAEGGGIEISSASFNTAAPPAPWACVQVASTNGPLRLSSNGTNPRWGRPYRGTLEIWPQRAPEEHHRRGDLTVINVVPLEDYLYGVVPWEMSPSAPIEALKAQAICARTKTLAMAAAHKFSAAGFDVCDYDASQGYPGAENETPASTAAVFATRGEILTYAGHPIDAVYCTNSGGITASSADVWHHDAPYLQSVPEGPDPLGVGTARPDEPGGRRAGPGPRGRPGVDRISERLEAGDQGPAPLAVVQVPVPFGRGRGRSAVPGVEEVIPVPLTFLASHRRSRAGSSDLDRRGRPSIGGSRIIRRLLDPGSAADTPAG